jgi:hypothetical protein
MGPVARAAAEAAETAREVLRKSRREDFIGRGGVGLTTESFHVGYEGGDIGGCDLFFEGGHARGALRVFDALEDLVRDLSVGEFTLGEIAGIELLAGGSASLAVEAVARCAVGRKDLSAIGGP